MQQLHGFDELRNNQGIILNRTSKTSLAVISLYFSASYLSRRFILLAKRIKRMENGKKCVFQQLPQERTKLIG
jgi:hypothetical protein